MTPKTVKAHEAMVNKTIPPESTSPKTLTPEGILTFWFGSIENGFPTDNRNALWFGSSEATDRTIHDQFSAAVTQALAGDLNDWLSPRARLARVILLDQMTRSLFRKTKKAFSGDLMATQAVKDGLKLGQDKQLQLAERVFFYMPLMHSESLEDQELCVELFSQMKGDAPDEHKEKIAGNLHFAIDHRDVIARFQRFPHRNKALNRESTQAEIDYLESANSYGQ